MHFTKMHGLGNDYIYIDGFEQTVDDPAALAAAISDRHFGVGSDGLILILPSQTADVRMRMFNADGSEAQMCGNGLRCLAKYAWEHERAAGGPCRQSPGNNLLGRAAPRADSCREIRVETGRGVLTAYLAIEQGRVHQVGLDMGEPILLPTDIPVRVTGQQAVGIPLDVADRHLLLTAVSMGNPHAIFFCPDVDQIDLEHIGPPLENHPLFPQRTNVHFVQPLAQDEVRMRTWERGSGITLACGTGAAAVCVAGVLASKTGRGLLAHLPGGDLRLCWDEQDNHVYLVGPAVAVFEGDWPG